MLAVEFGLSPYDLARCSEQMLTEIGAYIEDRAKDRKRAEQKAARTRGRAR